MFLRLLAFEPHHGAFRAFETCPHTAFIPGNISILAWKLLFLSAAILARHPGGRQKGTGSPREEDGTQTSEEEEDGGLQLHLRRRWKRQV